MEELKELHNTLLDMLKEFDEFTKKNGLSFFLVGGSALGAYRHKGFIPWDDDVDIALMRSDFEKLEHCMKKVDNRIGNYVYSPVEAHLMPDAPIGYLYDNAHAGKGYEFTAKIDIHPIDGVPESGLLRKLQNVASKVYYLSVYRLPAKNKGKFARNMTKVILKITPDFMFSLYMKITKKIFTAWDDRTSKNICSLFGVAGYQREIMPRQYLMPLTKSEFDGLSLNIPGDIKPYLERLYGAGYNELPPKEEQIPRHELYKTYQKNSQEDN